MRQETNNEIDLLLRRLSRRQEVPASDADSRIDSDHLDADELSAYAENALPLAARARYTEHLADCSKCREIVVQLSASVPVVAAKETVTAAAPFGLRKFLASFFSPMVLRYAVPALGLIVVAAIGFVVFRSNQPLPRVAQLDRQGQSPATNPSTEQAPSGFYDSNAPTKSSSPAVPRQSIAEKQITAAAEPPPPSASPPAGNIASPKTDAPAQRTEQQPAVASAAAAPPQSSPTPAATVDEMRVDIQGRRNEPAGAGQARDLAKQRAAADFEQKKAEDLQAARERSPRPGASNSRAQRGGTTSTFGVAEEGEKDLADGVIRTVAGRRFRKKSGAWVDTAYNSGSAIVNIARGSEQYRALVADEPEIKTIADELAGPIVVVWKGRTYRIR